MLRKNGKLVFEPNGNTRVVQEWLRVTNIVWGSLTLQYRVKYQVGNLFTDSNNPVPAWLYIKNSEEVTVVDRYTLETVTNRPDVIAAVKLDFSCNCFGFSFADGKYWIPNPHKIIEDEYDRTESNKKAEKVLIFTNKGINDGGQKELAYSHVVDLNPSGTLNYKPGVHPAVSNAPITKMRGDDDYDSCKEVYIAAKRKTIKI